MTTVRSSRARAYLELVRVPNLFTAAGDIFAGYLILSRGVGIVWPHLLALVAASVCLYAGGVVLNDYFDRDVDRVERPERPIPSGRVRPDEVLKLGMRLLGLGCVFAVTVGAASFAAAALLSGCIVLYDARGKRIPYVGGVNMGLCRFLNVCLGASGVAAPSPELWLWLVLPVATIVLVYIAAVTVLSTGEVWGGNRGVAGGVLAALVAVIGAIFWLDLSGRLDDWAYLPFLAVFAAATLSAVGRVVREPSAPNIRRAIKTCVLSLLLLDAAIAAGAAGLVFGLVVAALIVPSLYIARLIAVT
ncbi:MAG: UbiA-like protein EboC [Chloroflexota bacterium]|nr:UbiA-like protein EboC [Chloroflexota bacterium]